jgi:hypothetical protein
MILSIFYITATILLNMWVALWSGFTDKIFSYLNLDLNSIAISVHTLIQPAYYFNGLFPVQDFLNFIARILLFLMLLGTFNAVMYLWSKIPFIGKGGHDSV